MRSDTLMLRLRHLARRALGRGDTPLQGAVVPPSMLELARSGPAPLTPASESATPGRPLRIAVLIPQFKRGSGGHRTVVTLAKELVRGGHSVSVWLDRLELLQADEARDKTRQRFTEFFDAGDLELQTDFARWQGADVVLATGWQTVPRALLLPAAACRAYLVQDHEPEFYGASAEALFAATTYRQGLHCIAASPWLAELLRSRYGASASHFDLAVDHTMYYPGHRSRRDDLILFYSRSTTPRRAVPLGLLALQELARRRPSVEIAIFGNAVPQYAPFPHTDLGVLGPVELAALYRRATVGMVFSLTNPSLIGLEMMSCGLPCVELASDPMLSSFGRDSPLQLAEPAPLEICSTIEGLLDDSARRAELSRAGAESMRSRTWDKAAKQLECGLRVALMTAAKS